MFTRLTVEDALAIDLADPAIRSIVGRATSRGVLSWHAHGQLVAAVSYRWAYGELRLAFVSGGLRREQLIATTSSCPNLGGARVWFLCPVRCAPVRALFLAPNMSLWAGRAAHKLSFASQGRRKDLLPAQLAALLTLEARVRALERRNRVRALRRRERAELRDSGSSQ